MNSSLEVVAMIKQEVVTLDNNIKLVLSEDKSKNQSYASISVKYGSFDTKYQIGKKKYKIKEGTAHLLEHTIIENTIYGNMFEYLRDQFVNFNGVTSAFKTTFYINTVLEFERHLVELINIVNKPVFDAEKLELIKKPIYEEIKRVKDRPYKKFYDCFNKCLFHDRQAVETIGNLKSLESITVDDLKRVHEVYYQPENQVIFLGGNFDSKKIKKVILDAYKELNIPKIDYKRLDKKEGVKVKRKRGHVTDNEFDEKIRIAFKVDLKNLTPKERVKTTFYLNHFLDYNFDDGSKAYKFLQENKETNFSIDRSIQYDLEDLVTVEVLLYGNNVKLFKKIVFDVFKNKYYDEEIFNLWKKSTLINIILRSDNVFASGQAFLDNVDTFNYPYNDTIEDIEEFNIEDYQNLLNKLDFSHYTIIDQTKK